MRLWHTKTVWEKLARKDPYWAVLTDPDKTENRWEISAFFATGRQTVETDMRMIAAEAPTMRTERVLDFGCGVGRLSQGLATHFDHVDGVDISATMIDLAREHNQHADRVRYHLNAASDLRIFPDHHFDLIYSVITLQHIPGPIDSRLLNGVCACVSARRADLFPTPYPGRGAQIQVLLLSTHPLETFEASFPQNIGN